jgi:hypothetical protein
MLKMIGATILVLMGLFQAPAYAGDPFEIAMQIFQDTGYYNSIYYAPPNNIIKVRNDGPVRPLKVVLKNVTSSTQHLNTDLSSQGFDLITFEMTDERGNNNVVTKKIDLSRSGAQGYDYIGPGKTKEFEILLTEREWNNAFKLTKQGATQLRARVSYRNGSNVIYSDYYTILFQE